VGLFHCVEVRPLNVLDDRDGKLIALSHLAYDGRNMVQAGHLSGSDTPLSGYELVAIEDFGDEHRLEDAVKGNAAGK
jgi:hypothetical protein